MKKKSLMRLSIILCLSLLLSNETTPIAFAFDGEVTPISQMISVPTEAKNYFDENYEKFIQVAVEFQEYNSYRISDVGSLTICNPYIILMLDQTKQDEIYYYPIADKNTEQILFVIGIIGTVNGYTYEVNENLVDLLNKADYVHNLCIVYKNQGEISVQNENQEIFRSEQQFASSERAIIQQEKSYIEINFTEKIKLLNERANDLVKFSPVEWASEEEQHNAILKGSLTLYVPVGQYSYGMCWASTAATIINYVQKKSVSGMEICTVLGIGFNDGGTLLNLGDALSRYGVSYGIAYYSLSWAGLTKNIDASKPIAIAGYTGGGTIIGHAVTIYGYGSSSVAYFWDPAMNNGNGGYNNFVVGTTNKIFTSNGTTYEWTGTVSYYLN